MSDDPKDKKGKSDKPTLTDDQIETKQGMSRRRMLRGFGLGGLGLGGAAVAGCVPTTTTGILVGSGTTDIDNGNITDPVGFGRGSRRGFRTGITDADFGGNITDPVGFGRG